MGLGEDTVIVDVVIIVAVVAIVVVSVDVLQLSSIELAFLAPIAPKTSRIPIIRPFKRPLTTHVARATPYIRRVLIFKEPHSSNSDTKSSAQSLQERKKKVQCEP